VDEAGGEGMSAGKVSSETHQIGGMEWRTQHPNEELDRVNHVSVKMFDDGRVNLRVFNALGQLQIEMNGFVEALKKEWVVKG
jgi:hypothetical protein